MKSLVWVLKERLCIKISHAEFYSPMLPWHFRVPRIVGRRAYWLHALLWSSVDARGVSIIVKLVSSKGYEAEPWWTVKYCRSYARALVHPTPCVVRIDQSLHSTDLIRSVRVRSANSAYRNTRGRSWWGCWFFYTDCSRCIGRSTWSRAVGGAWVYQSGKRLARRVYPRLGSGTRRFFARKRWWSVQHSNSINWRWIAITKFASCRRSNYFYICRQLEQWTYV